MVNKQRLVQQFLDLVAIDCESFHEREMADYLKQQYGRLDILLEEDDTNKVTGSNAGNLWGVWPGEGDDSILLSGHMDTVQPGRGKRAIVHEDGTITSDGTTVLGADDAAANAILLEAIREVREEGLPHRTVEILHTVAEEVYCVGAGAFDYSRVRSDVAYCLDCSDRPGAYSAQEPTLITFTATVRGKAAHAGFEPEKGVNSLAAAAAAITRIKQGRPDEQTTVNLGKMRAGLATNIVPEETVVEGEIRSSSHEHALKVMDEIRQIFTEEAKRIGAFCEVDSKIKLVAYHIDEEDPALRRYVEALKQQGVEPYAKQNFGGSDVNWMKRNGINGICTFNSMHKCHTTEEYAVIDELVLMVEVVKHLMVL